MKLMRLSVILMGFCFFGNSYAMENGQDNNIKEVINMRDQLIKATTIIETIDRVKEMPIFKSVEDVETYNRQETREALCAIAQVYGSWLSVSSDAKARPEHKDAANVLLDQAVELREKIGVGLDL